VKTDRRRRGLVVWQLVLILVVIAVLVALVILLRSRSVTTTTTSTGASVPAAVTDVGLPDMPVKPTPREITFDGCPPEGDGHDRELNRLKNRVDEGKYVPVRLDAIVALPWPRPVEREARASWSAVERAAVARYEGIPVSVEGYLASAKVEGPESPNCHGADGKYRDWHVWLSATPGRDRTRSVVVEVTPRVRAQHPGWRIAALRRAARDSTRVRISGWLMLDQEHPEQVGKTRGTIWEIHPIMRIEMERGGRWVSLDERR
jgi:hypothetical protein